MAAIIGSTIGEWSLEMSTAKINFYKGQVIRSVFEIGKELLVVKDHLNHGEWESWLEQSVGFTSRTARHYMRVAEEFSGQPLMENLPYTKLVALLALPAEERIDFVAEAHDIGGESKSVQDMSVSELKAAINVERGKRLKAENECSRKDEEIAELNQQIDEAAEEASQFEQRLKAATKENNQLQERVQRLMDETSDTHREVSRLERELASRPVEVAVEVVNEDAIREDERRKVEEEYRGSLSGDRTVDDYIAKSLESDLDNMAFRIFAQISNIDDVQRSVNLARRISDIALNFSRRIKENTDMCEREASKAGVIEFRDELDF